MRRTVKIDLEAIQRHAGIQCCDRHGVAAWRDRHVVKGNDRRVVQHMLPPVSAVIHDAKVQHLRRAPIERDRYSQSIALGDRERRKRDGLDRDRRGVIGVVNFPTLEREAAEGAARLLGELAAKGAFPHVHPDQGLELALERMGANEIEVLPVVSRADVHKLEGILTLRDVLDSYGVSPRDRA